MGRTYPPPSERFAARVDKSGDCWLWTAGRSRDGYGMFRAEAGRKMYAHRWSYAEHFGPIPEGMDIDHLCHNRACVNPAHLRLATRKQNAENRRGAQSNSRSGVRGVSWCERTNRWRAVVGHHGKHVHVGRFLSLADAEAAVIAKRRELYT